MLPRRSASCRLLWRSRKVFTAIQNQLQSQSALRLGVTRVQTLALTAAQKIQNTVTAHGTKATIARPLR